MVSVRNFNWKKRDKIKRAGIIFYCKCDNDYYFLFTLDKYTASLGDFGGHVEKDDIDILDSILREYSEESLNIFSNIKRDDLKDGIVFEGNDSIEILYYLGELTKNQMNYYQTKFKSFIKNDYNHEVQNLIWLKLFQIKNIVKYKDFISEGTKIYSFYHRILEIIENNFDTINSIEYNR